MNDKHIKPAEFLWVLQGLCAMHRKPFSTELAQQQLVGPHTIPSLLSGAQAYGFDGSARAANRLI